MTSRFAETRARRPKAETLDLVATTSGDDDAASTMVDQIAVVIRQAILQGQYGPGERIKVAEIAQRFGFSSMPIREALRKLEGEGIVLIAPNRGATVRTLDRPFIEDLYDVRTALEPADLAGEPVAVGTNVVTLLGAANRDPSHFTDPDRFDVARDEGPPMSFASGIHYCLGANLARAEGQEVFAALRERCRSIELDGPLVRRHRMTLRGFHAVPVSVTPR